MEAPIMPPAPAPQHVEDIVELVGEILLRLPPAEPASLVRAAIVCKSWCSLISSHRFRRLYRDFHKTPPMLGFFHHSTVSELELRLEFHTTTDSHWTPASTKGFLPRDPDGGRYDVYDCRHGRFLLNRWDDDNYPKFVVWDPMTGNQRPLELFDESSRSFHGAAVLCGVGGCDHGACHMGPFRVVYISVDDNEDGEEGAWVFVSSSKTCKWRQRAFLQLPCSRHRIDDRPFVLVAEAFYCLITSGTRNVLKYYNLGNNRLSVLNVAPKVTDRSDIPPALVTFEDGGLGLAHLDKLSLHMWSYDDGVAEWTLDRVIDLNKTPLPIGDPMILPQLAGAVEGARTIFVVTDLGTYVIDLTSLTSKKLSQEICSTVGKKVTFHILPYVSFFNRPVATPRMTASARGGAAFIRRSKRNRRPNPRYL